MSAPTGWVRGIPCTITTQGGRRAEGTAQGRRGKSLVLVEYCNKANQPRLRWIPVKRVTLRDNARIEDLPRYLPRTICRGVAYRIVPGTDAGWHYDHKQRTIETPLRELLNFPTRQDFHDWHWKVRWQSVDEIRERLRCDCGRNHKPAHSWVTVGDLKVKIVVGVRPINELRREGGRA